MAKRLFLLSIFSFIGVVLNPNFLMADVAQIKKEPAFRAVETVEIEKKEPVVKAAITNPTASPVVTKVAASTPVYRAPAPANSIAITGRTLEIVQVPDTSYNSGNHVNRYGDRFLYGHNSGAVFGGLTSLGVGSDFSVTLGGVTTNYRVSKVVIYEKNVGNGLLQLNGSGNYMRKVANAIESGVQYSLSIMTCYGTSYGNGDASHRLVIFANAV